MGLQKAWTHVWPVPRRSFRPETNSDMSISWFSWSLPKSHPNGICHRSHPQTSTQQTRSIHRGCGPKSGLNHTKQIRSCTPEQSKATGTANLGVPINSSSKGLKGLLRILCMGEVHFAPKKPYVEAMVCWYRGNHRKLSFLKGGAIWISSIQSMTGNPPRIATNRTFQVRERACHVEISGI